MMCASIAKMPTWAITEDESRRLAAAITRVTELYEMPLLDEKTRAWLNLSIVGFEVYGTRVMAELTERKKRQPNAPPMVITPIRPQRDATQYPPPVEAVYGGVEM